VMAPQSCKPGCVGDAMIGHRIEGIKFNMSAVSNGVSSSSSSSSTPPEVDTTPAAAGSARACSPSFHCRPWSTAEKLWVDVKGMSCVCMCVCVYVCMSKVPVHRGFVSSRFRACGRLCTRVHLVDALLCTLHFYMPVKRRRKPLKSTYSAICNFTRLGSTLNLFYM